MERWLRIRLGLVVGLLFVVAVVYAPVVTTASPQGNVLTVRFLDVGQGDAIHILTPDGVEVLIDGGSSAVVLSALARGRSFFDSYIDVVIATHPDTDHIGGLVDVLERYQVGMILESQVEHDAPAAAAFAAAAGAEGAQLVAAQAGQVLRLGASTTIEILSPVGDTTQWESNTASAVVILRYGETAFVLTGDAPQSIEEYLAGAYDAGLKANVLKLGHHGSNTSSSEVFLAAVHPTYAVVSAGKDNRYGHPHAEVLLRAGEAGAQIVSTAESGPLTFVSDGTEVWLKE